MKRLLPATFGLALILATSNALSVPQTTAPATEPGNRMTQQHQQFQGRQIQGKRAARRAAFEAKVAENPEFAAMVRMRALERIYRSEGKMTEVEALYRDVLGRSSSPALKNFAELRLARLQMRAGDAERAKQTLRNGLERNLQGVR